MQMGLKPWQALALGLGAALCIGAEPASQPAQPGAGGARPLVGNGVPVAVSPAKPDLERQKALIASKPEIARFKDVDELLHATIENSGIQVDTRSLDTLDGEGRVIVEGGAAGAASATWTVRVQHMGHAVGHMVIVKLTRYDWEQNAEGQFSSVSLETNNQNEFTIKGEGAGIKVSYQQFSMPNMPARVLLLVTSVGRRNGMHPALSAPSLLALKDAHGEEVRKYVQPLLKRLSGKDPLAAGAMELYSVLTDIPADAKVTQAVKDLLPLLDADAFEKRQAASAELAKLGRPGVLAVLRLDMTVLTEEQKARCRAFANTYRQGNADEDWEQKRQDPYFLLDAMEDDDAVVRAAAKGQLQRVMGHEVSFDVLAAQDVRFKAMDSVRSDVQKEWEAKTSTTQPAKSDSASHPEQAPAGANQPAGAAPIFIRN
jgi:hypothetical protein